MTIIYIKIHESCKPSKNIINTFFSYTFFDSLHPTYLVFRHFLIANLFIDKPKQKHNDELVSDLFVETLRSLDDIYSGVANLYVVFW